MKSHLPKPRLRYLKGMWIFAVLLLVILSSGCPPITTIPVASTLYDTNYRMVFRHVSGVSPTLDGLMSGDAGWTGSSRFNFEDGGTVYAAFMNCIADASFLYIYLEVEDNSFNSEDVVVIGLHTGTATNDYKRLHIYPFTTGGAPANGTGLNPTSIAYYENGSYTMGSGWTFTNPATPAGVQAKIATETGNNLKLKWSMEIKIPLGAPFNIPSDAFFGLYVDVARTDDPAFGSDATQWTWPPNRIIGSVDSDIYSDVDTGTPAPLQWGNASLTTLIGNGVYFTASDISTNQSDPGEISLNQDNIFYVAPHNNSINGSNALVTASSIVATFKLADWGLPGPDDWSLVPTGGPGVNAGAITPNPTAPFDIPPTGTVPVSTGPWHLTPAESQAHSADPHQCIWVGLTSSNANTVFYTPSAYRNMTFVTTSSPFERQAKIGTVGYKPAPHKEQLDFVLMQQVYNTPSEMNWKTEIRGATPKGNGRYIVSVPARQQAALLSNVTPPPVKIPSTYVMIPPGTGGKERPAIKIPVQGDDLVTLIAEGSILLRKGGKEVLLSNANGRDLSKDEQELASKAFLLSNELSPQRYVGAVFGSFDDSKESQIFIGQARTIKVPRGATTLSIAINDRVDGYALQAGEGYKIQVVRTPLEKYFLAATSILSRDPRAEYLPIPVGANLPTWILRGFRNTGKTIIIKNKKFDALDYVGSYGYILKEIGQ